MADTSIIGILIVKLREAILYPNCFMLRFAGRPLGAANERPTNAVVASGSTTTMLVVTMWQSSAEQPRFEAIPADTVSREANHQH